MLDKAGFSERLQTLIRERYGSRYAFSKATGISPSTAATWVKPEAKLPNGDSLADISQKTGASLNWLLFGEGTMLRSVSRDQQPIEHDLREAIGWELVRRGLSRPDVEDYLWGGDEIFAEAADRAFRHVTEISRLAIHWLEGTRPRTVSIDDLTGEIEFSGVNSASAELVSFSGRGSKKGRA